MSAPAYLSCQLRSAGLGAGDAAAFQPPLPHRAQQSTDLRPLSHTQRQHVATLQRKHRAQTMRPAAHAAPPIPARRRRRASSGRSAPPGPRRPAGGGARHRRRRAAAPGRRATPPAGPAPRSKGAAGRPKPSGSPVSIAARRSNGSAGAPAATRRSNRAGSAPSGSTAPSTPRLGHQHDRGAGIGRGEDPNSSLHTRSAESVAKPGTPARIADSAAGSAGPAA